MKKSDLAMIVLIASISVIGAFFITRTFFGEAVTEEVTVKTIDPINAEVTQPDPAVFNDQAINPSVEVQVGSGSQ